MSDTLLVQPVEGRKLPIEGMTRRYVDGPMAVPNRAYYRRALRRGDIQPATAPKPEPKPKPKPRKQKPDAGSED